MNNQLRKHVNTILIPHTAFHRGLQRLEQGFNSVEGNDAFGFSVIGESRCGKTTLVKYFASLHPKIREAEGLKTPILLATTPSKPTIKGMASSLLAGLGDPMAEIRESENQKTQRLLKLIKASGTRVIILDEVQHFVERYSNKVMYQVADWLKIVLDESGVMVVVSGLPYSNAVLLQNEQLRGRFLARLTLPRFDWTDEDSRLEFRHMLAAFNEAMIPFSLPDLGSEEMAYRFFLASGGLTGYVVKILKQATWNVLDEGKTVITMADLETAYTDALWDEEQDVQKQNPFGKKLPTTQEMFEHAQQMGKAVITEPKRRRGRPPKGPEPLAGVL